MGPADREFNPADFPPEYLTVGLAETLPSILDRVEEAWIRTPNVVLVIPRGSHAFHSTHDFLALGKLQDSREVRVSIASHDPIIMGLARLLGFFVVDAPAGHPALANDPAEGDAPGDNIEQPTAPLPLGAPPGPSNTTHVTAESGWVFVPNSPGKASNTTSTWLNNPEDYTEPPRAPKPGLLPPITAHTPGLPPPRTRPRQTGALSAAIITDTTLDSSPLQPGVKPQEDRPPDPSTTSGRLKARRAIPEGRAYQDGRGVRYGVSINPTRWSRAVVAFAVLLLALLAGGSAYAYVYLPQGTVSVTPLSQQISDLPVTVAVLTEPDTKVTAPPSRDAQTVQTITAAKISVPLVEEGTRPASGTRQVPRGKAQGVINFTNRTSAPVTVPAGTRFKASNGVTVQTTQSGTVPGTNFTAQSFGTLTLSIAAVVDGPDGNLAAGQLTGVYGGSLNYTNGPLQGGSIETIKVVKQEDIDGLVAELRGKLNTEAAGAVIGAVGAGQQIITQTISLQNVTFDPSRKAGEDGDSVRVKLAGEAQAFTFLDSDMQKAVGAAVHDYVQATYPQEVSPTLSRNLDYAPPALSTADAVKITYATSVSGRVAFALTPRLAAEIQDLVKGKSVDQARNLILQQSYSSYMRPDAIEAKLLWFTINTLPRDPGRISVQPAGQGATYPPAQPTPDPNSP